MLQLMEKLRSCAETELDKAVVEIVAERGDECKDFMRSILSGGCENGTVAELIYYSDTVTFYMSHKRDIQQLVMERMEDYGTTSIADLFGTRFDMTDLFCEDVENQNLLAWFGFEKSLQKLAKCVGLDE